MTDEQKPKKVCDEATLKRLAEMRKKSLQTRKMKSELKKTKKESEKEQLKKEYENVVMKKKVEPQEIVEETDKEIYERNNQSVQSDSEEEEVVVVKKNTRKPAKVVKQETPNYKNEYYRLKLERLSKERDEEQFVHNYSRLSAQHKVADIARSQITDNVNKEIYNRVFKDLFGC